MNRNDVININVSASCGSSGLFKVFYINLAGLWRIGLADRPIWMMIGQYTREELRLDGLALLYLNLFPLISDKHAIAHNSDGTSRSKERPADIHHSSIWSSR